MKAKAESGGNWQSGIRKCPLSAYRAPSLESRGCRRIGEVEGAGRERQQERMDILVRKVWEARKVNTTEI